MDAILYIVLALIAGIAIGVIIGRILLSKVFTKAVSDAEEKAKLLAAVEVAEPNPDEGGDPYRGASMPDIDEEKLFEELLIGDNVERTTHPLIMRAQEAELTWNILQVSLEQLEQACANFEYEKVREILQQLVAEYEPQCGIEDFIWHAKQSNHINSINH